MYINLTPSPILKQFPWQYASLAMLMSLTAGCAVLTDSQIDEVNRFSRAAAAYETLPGEPIAKYGELAAQDRVFNLATKTLPAGEDGNAEWAQLQKAIQFDQLFSKDSVQINASLDLLTTYVEGLQQLTSKDLTENLDKSAEGLGVALDKATKQYNELVRKPNGQQELSLIGGTIAAAVRTGGGLFISHRQARYLKDFVIEANPIITSLMAEIQSLMDRMTDNLNRQEDRIQNNFTTLFSRRHQLSPETIEIFRHQLETNHQAKQLTHAAKTAANSFVNAHQALVANLNQRQTVSTRIAVIETMIEQIKQGLALRNKLVKS